MILPRRFQAALSGGGLSLSKAWSQLAGLALMLAAAKLLTPTQFGVFALASAATMILNQLVGVGPYEFVIRERLDRGAPHTAFWINMGASLVLTCIGLGVAAASNRLFHNARLPGMIAILALLTFPAGWRSVLESLLVREGRIGALAVATIIVETLGLACGVAALLAGWGVYALVAQKVVQFVSGVPVYTIAARWRPAFRFDRAAAKGMTRFGAGIFGDRVLGYLQAYGVDLILGLLVHPAGVAVYRLGARIVVALAAVLFDPLRVIFWSRLSRARAADGDVGTEAEGMIGSAILVVTGPLAGLALTADLLIKVLLGGHWDQSAQVASILAVGSLVTVPTVFTDAILGMKGQTRALIPLKVLTVSILLVALLLLARYGPVWTAVGQTVAAVCSGIIVIAAQRRIGRVRPQAYRRTVMLVAAAALAMASAVFASRAGLAALGAPPAGVLAGAVVAGAAAYLIVCRVAFGRGAFQLALGALRS